MSKLENGPFPESCLQINISAEDVSQVLSSTCGTGCHSLSNGPFSTLLECMGAVETQRCLESSALHAPNAVLCP